MTVKDLIANPSFTALTVEDENREIVGAYCGDLLSWVMGRAKQDNAWITIMSNLNVVAVASLTDVSVVILSEGVTVDEEVLSTAKAKGINLLSTELTSYETAVLFGNVL